MELETKVAVLSNEITRMTTLFEKMDSAIEKMGEVSNTIGKMLAVHEQKLTQHQQVDQELYNLVEKRREELQTDIKELHSRITTLSREVSGDLEETEKRIMVVLTTGLSDIKRVLTEEREVTEQSRRDLQQRVNDLEKWRWITVGGTAILALFARDIFNFIFSR